MENSLTYVISDDRVSTDELRRIADEVWNDLRQPGSPSAQEASAAGFDLDSLPENRSEALVIRPTGQPFAGGIVEIIVQAVAIEVASGVILDLWRRLILPSILRRFGDHAVQSTKTDSKP